MLGESWRFICREMKLGLYQFPAQTLDPNDLKPETLKLLDENIGSTLSVQV